MKDITLACWTHTFSLETFYYVVLVQSVFEIIFFKVGTNSKTEVFGNNMIGLSGPVSLRGNSSKIFCFGGGG